MMASTAENVHTPPQILTMSSDTQARVQSSVCDVEMLPVPESSSPDLLFPLIVEEDYMTTTRRTTSHDAILDHQEFAVPFPNHPADIHGSARSHQGVQGTCSSEQMAFRAASSVNHSEVPNISNGGSTLNTSLSNNPAMGQNPPRHLFNDPYEYELEKIRIEEDILKKSVEDATSQLKAELDRKMAEAQSQFDKESQELDAQVMEVETRISLVRAGSLLGNAFVSKCSERSASNDLAAVRAMISQHSTQQQQAVQTNTQMSSTAPPRARPQQEVQASTHMSISAPPRPSVTSVDAPVPNSSGPFPHLQRRPTTQPSPISQQTVQAAHTHVNSTAPTPPSVTSVEAPMPNSIGPLPHLQRRLTSQPSPMSQQTVQAPHTHHVNSTAPTPPSVTSVEAPVPNSTGPLPHLPRRTTTQTSPMSQQTVQAANTHHVNSTVPTPPSVERQTPNHLRPLVRFPRAATTQPSPMSQQAVAQSNTNVNSTEALPRPSSVTTEALPLHSPLSNTPRPRPRPVISNLTPSSSSSPPVQGTGLRGPAPHIVRASAPHLARRPAPHLRQYGSSSPAPMSAPAAAAAATTHPRRPVQEQEQQQQQQQRNSNGGLVHLSDED